MLFSKVVPERPGIAVRNRSGTELVKTVQVSCRCEQLSQLSFACIALCLLEIAFFFQGVYSRKCAFRTLLISSASNTECGQYPARANDGQIAGPSHWRNSFTNDCCGSEMLREFD
jgi:hypothetical protein